MMMGQEDNRELISREELLKLANELIKKDYDYLDGMRADEVEQKGDYLVFKGEFFFDDDACLLQKLTPFLICLKSSP